MKSDCCKIPGLFFMILILGLALANPAVAQNNTYNITDLGTLGGNQSAAYGINNSAQVVGSSRTDSGSFAPFLWTQADGMVYLNLDILNLGSTDEVTGAATGVNDQGQVTGYGYNSDYIYSAFIWSVQEGMKNLSAGNNYCVAKGINRIGQVAGSCNSPSLAFLWGNGAPSDLGTLGGESSWANGINNLGYVVGGSNYNSSGASHAFLWTPEKGMTDLGTLAGINSEAMGINDLGQVVGYSDCDPNADSCNGMPHAFFWTAEKGMKGLGTLGGINSEAMGINDLGQIVGDSETASGNTHAFLWESDRMQDLNNLIPAGSGWELLRALAINKYGQIVGYGNRDTNGDGVLDAVHAFLLTPIKENPPPSDPVKPLEVGIDIWPSSGSGRINLLFKYGMIRVTIFSTKDFYAPDMIDRHSLTFGETGSENSLAFCRSHPRYGHHHGSKDLVCYFYARHAGFKCGDTEGILKGKTVKGRPIEGRDAVQIVPCPKRKNIHGSVKTDCKKWP